MQVSEPPESDPQRFRVAEAQLLVVDMQERLLPHIAGHEAVVAQCVRMIRACRELDVPIVVSEQYPQGLGRTDPRIVMAVGDAQRRVEKLTFSVCRDAAAFEPLEAARRPAVLLVGIETHVCVQQTALDLLSRGMRPIVMADAVSSRREFDRTIALERMRSAGAIVTTVESAIYELMERAGTDAFKRILPLVR